jgi:error-prone DNA polymerase
MKIAIVAAGFPPGEADKLRRAMATFRRSGTIQFFRDKFINGMTGRGYEQEFAERCFRQIEGFGEYGFPESHAASFALLVYASAWIKCHYPDVFCAALLNSQPMGFYAPAQIVRDAREHGVTVLPPDVNLSDWDNQLEPEDGRATDRLHKTHAEMRKDIRTNHAVRLGFRQISGFSQDDALKLMVARRTGYDSVRDLWLRSGLTRAAIERLAEADAFRSLGLDRRAALWAAQGLGGGGRKDRLPLFDQAALGDIRREPDVDLPPMPLGEHVVNDYRTLSLSLKAHPVSFLRARLAAEGVVENRRLGALPDGKYVMVSGLVLVRQRPGTASGVIFMTIEDETGIANAIIWPRTFERFRPVVLGARLVTVTGKMQSEKGVIHVIADRIEDRTPLLAMLSADNTAVEPLSRADEVKRPPIEIRKKVVRQALLEGMSPALIVEAENSARVMPKGRNFH